MPQPHLLLHSTGQTGTPWEPPVFLGSSWGFWSARYCAGTGAGKYVTDTGRNVAGIVGGHPGGVKLVSDGGDLYDLHTEGAFYQMYRTGVSYFGGSSGSMLVSFGIDASRSWGVEHSGAEFAAAHYKQPVALYLGKTAKI